MLDISTILREHGVIWAILAFLIGQSIGMAWFLLRIVRKTQNDLMRTIEELIERISKPASDHDVVARITIHDLELLKEMLREHAHGKGPTQEEQTGQPSQSASG